MAPNIEIGGRPVGDAQPVYVVPGIGVNHAALRIDRLGNPPIRAAEFRLLVDLNARL